MAKKLILAALPFLFFISKISVAQRTSNSVGQPVGVIWSAPINQLEAQEQLKQLASLGVQYLQIDDELPPVVWQTILQLDFKVYALLPVRFPVTPAFGLSDSTFKESINSLLKQYASHQSIKAVGFFAYGPVTSRNFQKAVSRFVASLENKINLPRYYITSRPFSSPIDTLFDFKILHVSPDGGNIKTSEFIDAYFFTPMDGATQQSLWQIKSTLKSIHKEKKVPVFLGASQLLNLTKKFPEFKKTLTLYSTTADYPIPVNSAPFMKSNQSSFIIMLLLLAWVILSFTYYVSPVYRRSFYRYFTGHQFYLIDVFERHIRSNLPGASILIQQIIFSGVVFYCIGTRFLSPLGKEALIYHYPFISIFGESNLMFLLWGFLTAILFLALCICWLLIAAPQIKHFSQILNIYPWLLQLNIIVVTIMVTVYASGGSRLLLFIASLLFLLISLAPFIITSIDGINFLNKKNRIWVANSTFVLYIVLLAGLGLWIYLSPQLLKIAELALTL